MTRKGVDAYADDLERDTKVNSCQRTCDNLLEQDFYAAESHRCCLGRCESGSDSDIDGFSRCISSGESDEDYLACEQAYDKFDECS